MLTKSNTQSFSATNNGYLRASRLY